MVITGLVFACLLAGLLFTQLKPSLVFIAEVAALYMFGVVDQEIIFNNITNRSVITLILLLVASLALERSMLLS
ncbi:hypothetical protein VCRA2133E348_210066 [Vibrio crassostreae]|nr:hypothetical protein VCRA2119O48_200069 [Vibrio crassostreae]CAK2771405.1 hypothetical protein VCRA2133E348_210066 [Vibrio crassostreae]CAK3220782.1 hypothetical protein VCRA213O314_190033 [Vibrio crassostreae]CAK3839700.1 hypothetical protein VCRA212O16_210069 [Vibrio crassostreae]